MEHKRLRCPNCGRILTQEEMYCYFCEMDMPKLMKKHSKPKKHPAGKSHSPE